MEIPSLRILAIGATALVVSEAVSAALVIGLCATSPKAAVVPLCRQPLGRLQGVWRDVQLLVPRPPPS